MVKKYVIWIDINIQLEATRWLCHQDIAFSTFSIAFSTFQHGIALEVGELGFCFPNESDSILFALRWA